jgi:biotin-dependent carboxylase-like uncharacterized protein
MLHVLRPGLLTTVQDRGRWGYQAYGVPVAGAMDEVSHRLANALVGNGPDAATLEVTIVGPELEFEDQRAVAVAGARFELTVDGRSAPLDERVLVGRGSQLRFGRRTSGTRAYLAVEGGIDLPAVLGSRSTHVASRLGGLDGRPLARGDRLPLGGRTSRHSGRNPAPRPIEALLVGGPSIRILIGPNQESFTRDAVDVLRSSPYVVGVNSDRMGYRLEGPSLAPLRAGDIISEATPLGTLQVPPSGQPILLMADRHTAGGYPKIATVISADVHRAGQLGPGDQVSFEVCSPREAIAALRAQEHLLAAFEARALA